MNQIKLSKQNLKEIRTFARERVGGFGMWLELGEKVFYTGEVIPPADWSNVKSEYGYNMLKKADNQDLSDFVDWHSLQGLEIELVNGFALLDFYVHDKEELKDNVQALINDKGEVVKMWRTWHNENELLQLTGKEAALHP